MHALVLWLWLIVDIVFDVGLFPGTAIVVGIGKVWRDFVEQNCSHGHVATFVWY